MQVHDARPNKVDPSLDTHGFTFCEDKGIGIKTVEAIRQRDSIFVSENYCPVVEALLKKGIGRFQNCLIRSHVPQEEFRTLAEREPPRSIVSSMYFAYIYFANAAIGLLWGPLNLSITI